MPGTAIPANFARAMRELYGEEGRRWIDGLPALLDGLAAHWALTLEPAFPLTYNYVAPAIRADGTPAVLKVGYPDPELPAEFAAVAHFAGHGGARLLATDQLRGAMLLERLLPGAPLSTMAEADDAQATRIAARLIVRSWHTPPVGHAFPAIADWGQGFLRLRQEFDGGAGPFPGALVDEAESTFAELESTQGAPVLLHGDFHHGNILDAGAGDWRLIDPKGLVGEPAYEPGTFLQNPRRLFREPTPGLGALLGRRLDIFAEELVLDRERIRRWALAQSVLSAWWSYEDHRAGWEPALKAAELLGELR